MIEHVCDFIGSTMIEDEFPHASHNNPYLRDHPIILEISGGKAIWTYRENRQAQSRVPIRFCPFCALELPRLILDGGTDPRSVGNGIV